MAAFMRSVSMFLVRGRRASRTTESNKLKSSASADQIHQVQRRGTLQEKKTTFHKKMQPASNTKGKCSSAQLIESLKKRTHFNKREIEALLKLHRSLAANAQKRQMPRGPKPANMGSGSEGGRAVLDRECFRELLHNSLDLTEEKLMERIFHAFDKRSEGVIDGERWVLGMSVLLKGSLAEKQSYCFNVYDLNGDGFISKEEILHLLSGCLATPATGDEDPEEGVRDLTDVALRKMDVDRDGKLSFNDYVEANKQEPLLLEAFGPCLPSEQTCESFLATLLRA
ncbi:calaxin-like [Neocloeon triangulifer]|uniref:calaxin-like n=1 Tax=Neocloeon triangulifer TaxID=2078957 RepID=UPI00286EF78E|nr:calaxin-like [Neocloeon triangulifer]